jgi:hypothetical protein
MSSFWFVPWAVANSACLVDDLPLIYKAPNANNLPIHCKDQSVSLETERAAVNPAGSHMVSMS